MFLRSVSRNTLIVSSLLFIITFSLSPIHAQETSGSVFWSETGATVPIPEGFNVVITDNDELLLSTIPDIREIPDFFEPGEAAIELNFIGMGTAIPLDGDIMAAMNAYISRQVPVTSRPEISTYDIAGRPAVSIQTTITEDENTIGFYLLMISPDRPGALYPLMGIGYHPDDDVSALIASAPSLAEAAYFPPEDATPPGEAVNYGDYTIRTPEGWNTVETDGAIVSLTNITADRLPISVPDGLQDGDIFITFSQSGASDAEMDERDAIEAYAGESNSSISWRVGKQNITGLDYDFEGGSHRVHVPRRPDWSTDPYTLIDVYSLGVSNAVLTTQLRTIIAGLTLPEWTVNTDQPLISDSVTINIPGGWSQAPSEGETPITYFVDSSFIQRDFDEANPGDVLIALVPDALLTTGLDNGDDLQPVVDTLVMDFGAQRIYATRELVIDGVSILVADVTGIEDRTGPSTFFAHAFVLPPDANGRVIALQVIYERRIDYETSVQALMQELLRQLVAAR